MSGLCLRDTRQRKAKNQQQCSSVRSHSVRQREYSMPPRGHGRGQGDVRESHKRRHDAATLELRCSHSGRFNPGRLAPNPYLDAFKAARAFFTNREGISCERRAPGEAIGGGSQLKARLRPCVSGRFRYFGCAGLLCALRRRGVIISTRK